MLPTIHLQVTDFAALDGDPAPYGPIATDSATPVGSFAELLRAPILVAPPALGGEGLPADGNPLPLPPDGLEALTRLAPEPRTPFVTPPSPAANEHAARVDAGAGELLARAEAAAVLAADVAAEDNAGEMAVAAPPMLPAAALTPVDTRDLPRPRRDNTPPASTVIPATVGPAGKEPPPEPAIVALRPQVLADAARNGSPSTADTARGASVPLLADNEPPVGRTAPSQTGLSGDSLPGTSPPSTANATTFVTTANPTAVTAPTTIQAPLATTTPPVLEASIAVPVQDQAWGEVLNQRVVFMSSQRIQSAEIRLTPPELGPIRVSVAMEDGAANVTFNAQHPLTREAIEMALPRLREMLSDNGLALGDASVTDQGVNRDDGRLDARGRSVHAEPGEDNLTDDAATKVGAGSTRIARGLVDTYA